jgi:hypothetical protein
MKDTYKASVTNNLKTPIFIALPDVRFKRTWPGESTYKIPLEILREAVYDHGFMTFLEKGIMSIDEKEVRVELGLEEQDGESIFKTYNRSQLIKLLKVDTLEDLKEAIGTMSREQLSFLAEIAIDQKIGDMNKAEAIKKVSGIDIIKGIQLKMQNEENDEKEGE